MDAFRGIDGQIRDVFDRGDLRLRNLDLNLEAIAAPRIAPEIQVGVAARRGGGDQRTGDFGGRYAILPGAIAIDLDLQRRIIERLRILEIA